MQYCDILFGICQEPKDWLNIFISFLATVISFISLIISIRYASKTFRPLVSVVVQTHSGGNESITYNLSVLNSGSIPAKNIRLHAGQEVVSSALGSAEGEDLEMKWLSCFSPDCIIHVLQNGEKVSCSFGFTKANDLGFWKYGAEIPITVEYNDWFGRAYLEEQCLYIKDSDSFTGYMWS